MNKHIVTTYLSIWILFLLLATPLWAQGDYAGPVRYVKTDGAYANNGQSWATAKNNVQDAINDLYDYMQKNNQAEGRVYVAAGTYTPTESTESDKDGIAYTAFKIYEGITLYGGFSATAPEASPEDRAKITDEYGWKMTHETVLDGNHTTNVTENLTWNDSKQQFDTKYPGNSYHVVWFATKGFSGGRANALARPAGLDGFTIRGGYASNRTTGERLHNSFGAGAYMVQGSFLRNSIVTGNTSTRQGGGIYMDGGGEVDHCYIRYNQCLGVGIVEGFGGGIAVDGAGVVRHTVMAENVARIGGGLALLADEADAANRYAPTAAGNIVANNTTTTEAAGVYMRYGGVLNHMTIVNNRCNGRNIVYDGHRYGRSAGIYVDQYGQIFNSVCWGGKVEANSDIQYAAYTTASQTDVPSVHYSAFTQNDITDWSATTRKDVFTLSNDNRNTTLNGNYPEFRNPTTLTGVGIAADFTPLWQPYSSSSLKGAGVLLADYEYVVDKGGLLEQAKIESDIKGTTFAPKTTLGAYVPMSENIDPVELDGYTTLFVDPARNRNQSLADPEAPVGNSWDNPLGNLNDALLYFKYYPANATKKGRILVKEGELTTTGNYITGRLRSSSFIMESNVEVYGGYPATLTGTNTTGRNPVEYPTHVTGNIADDDYANNVHHLVRFQDVSNAVFDGFRLYYGNAYSENITAAGSKHGGGVIVYSQTGEDMTGNALRNCIIANCTGLEGAAVYVTGLGTGGADDMVSLSMENCIIHNNEGKDPSAPSAICAKGSQTTITLNHCTIRGNVGFAACARDEATITLNNSVVHANAKVKVDNISTLTSTDVLTVYAGYACKINGSNNLVDNGKLTPDDGTNNQAILTYASSSANYPSFVNPTRNVGVSEVVDNTVYGGYPNFMPENMSPLVNAASSTSASGTDITTSNTRNYGGLPDVGAVENTALPVYGTVYYVRKADGSDNDDGLSWANAFATVSKALEMAEASNGVCKQIWVAAGTYTENLTMVDGVNVYGGFIASGNPGMTDDERDISNMNPTYQTIIDGNAKGRVLDQGDNFANETMWEGFTFQNGKMTYSGSTTSLRLSTITETIVTETTYDPAVAATWDSYQKTLVECNAGDDFIVQSQTVREETTNVTDDYEEVRTRTTTKTNDYEEESILRSDWLAAIGNDNTVRQNSNSLANAKLIDGYGYYGEKVSSSIQDPLQTYYNTNSTNRNATFSLANSTLTISYRTSRNGSTLTKTYDCDYYTNSYSSGNNSRTYTITTSTYDSYYKVTYYTIKTTYYQTVTKYYRNQYSREIKAVTKSATKDQSFTDYQSGAGVRLFYNGTLKNCLIQNNTYSCTTGSTPGNCGGGGVFMTDGSTVKNCNITNNLAHRTAQSSAGSNFVCGGGILASGGTLINSLITQNETRTNAQNATSQLGGAAFVSKSASFYNCTIAFNFGNNQNSSPGATAGGIWDNAGTSYFYNCILWGNYGNGSTRENFIQITFSGQSSNKNLISSYHSTWVDNSAIISIETKDLTDTDKKNNYHVCNTSTTSYSISDYDEFLSACQTNSPFTDWENGDYSLNSSSPLAQYCINMGSDEYGDVLSETYSITEDIAGADRVQDCTIDKGAYEYNGAKDIVPDETTTTGTAYFYVTQNGRGTATAESPANAACREKLQKVLDVAGRYKYANPGVRVVVKLAAMQSGTDRNVDYMPRRSAVTDGSADVENPRSFSIMVPRGVEVWGGYTDAYTSTTYHGFLETNRNVMTNRTTLNGLYQANGQDVNVYHVVTFTDLTFDADGKVIEGQTMTDKALAMGNYNKAVLDGLHITGGMANGVKAEDQRGGAAIVTDFAHVRNCIVRDNYAAEEGGALYLQPRSLVSGTLLEANSTGGAGGAIFVEEPTSAQKAADATGYARIYTSTIVKNSAGQGGGINFETNLRANSVVVWNNEANAQANVSGQLDPFSTVASTSQTVEDYPMSFSAVENLRVAGINNLSVGSDNGTGVHFDLDDGYYGLTLTSVLGRAGMRYQDYAALLTANTTMLTTDFAGVDRVGHNNNYIDIGARAYKGQLQPTPSTSTLMKRLYVVAPELIVNLDAQNALVDNGAAIYKQQGSSFANPMSRLDDALEYIREARKNTSISGVADIQFEVFVSGGTFYPLRTIRGEYSYSRASTYLVPEGVSIVGGMDPDGLGSNTFYGQDDTQTTTTVAGTGMTVTIQGETTEAMREGRLHFDLNNNSIIEPWELEHQTILSGANVNSVNSENVYHVITAIAASDWVGQLPTGTAGNATGAEGSVSTTTGKRIVLDGLTVSDGEAYGYEQNLVGSKHTYYKGGAICVDGNWVTENGDDKFYYTNVSNPVGYRNIPLTVMNCQFSNNMGGMGGAIFSNGDLEIYGCSFTQNYSMGGTDVDEGGTTIASYTGNGGAVNASANLILVNSLFANNEARQGSATAEASGRGGAILAGHYSRLHVMNCNFVRNLAKDYPAIYNYVANQGWNGTESDDAALATVSQNNPHRVVNSIFWGNEVGAGGIHRSMYYGESGQEKEHLWFCAYGADCGLTPVYDEEGTTDYRIMPFNFATNRQAMYIPALFQKNGGKSEVTNNIILNSDNDALDGPNFINPSLTAGVDGYLASADWMLSRINNVVDNGWTFLNQQITTGDDGTYTCEFVQRDGSAGSGIYLTVADDSKTRNNGLTTMPYGESEYMYYPQITNENTGEHLQMYRVSKDPNPTHQQTYIDMGVYEYQHVQLKPTTEDLIRDVLWVTETERQDTDGPADGSSWLRATSDLQRAIETLLSGRNGHDKEIRIIEGSYMPVYTIANNLGFKVSTAMADNTVLVDERDKGKTGYESTANGMGVKSLTIRGGYSAEMEGPYDYEEYPVTFVASERVGASEESLKHLFYIEDARQRTSWKNSAKSTAEDYVIPIALNGITFSNPLATAHTETDGTTHGGAAIYYADQLDGTTPLGVPSTGKRLTLSNCTFLQNAKTVEVPAVSIGQGGGDALIYNSLFHSNTGAPLVAVDTKVINCTFALNGNGVKLDNKMTGYESELHNSILWRNNTTGSETVGLAADVTYTQNAIGGYTKTVDDDTNDPLSETNNDIFNGPNFADPENVDASARSFRISPSSILLSKGSEQLFVEKVGLAVTDGDYKKAVAATYDLAYFTRCFGSGLDRGAYECQEALNRVIYVDPNKVAADGNGKSWETAYGLNRLQNAIDAASVYMQTEAEEGNKGFAYVFVKGKREGSTGESIILREGVQVYGGIDPGYTNMAAADSEGDVATTDIEKYEAQIRADRPGLASPSTYRTVVNGVTATATVYDTRTLLDGFVVTAPVAQEVPVVDLRGEERTQNTLALRNCIIAGSTVTGDGQPVVNVVNGLLYNVLVQENESGLNAPVVKVGANGRMVNCTVVAHEAGKNTVEAVESNASLVFNCVTYNVTDNKIGRTETNQAFSSANNTINVSPFAPYLQLGTTAYHADKPEYLTENHYLWYQLHEKAKDLESADEGVNSSLPTELQGYVNLSSDRDVLGNPRKVSSVVDRGCFETWQVRGGMEMSDAYIPQEGSVVYIQPGASLKLDKAMTQVFRPAYLLLRQGASLYGQGANVELEYVAVEREVAEEGYSLLSLPYDYALGNAVRVNDDDGSGALTETTVDDAKMHTYDGAKRATYSYHFVEDDSPCWIELATGEICPANQGVLLTVDTEGLGLYRYTAYANAKKNYIYTEGGSETFKEVVLTQYNHTPADNAVFTSLENMGWNLVGMPYLVSNYATSAPTGNDTYQMNIPHVIYTLDAQGNYSSKQSWDAGADLSVGQAFFTQTATLDDAELLKFQLPVFPTTKASDTRALLCVASAAGSDAVQLTPDDDAEELSDYQLNYDAVKMMAMNKDLPQVYALNASGSRLALVGSAPVEQEIGLGLYAAKADEQYTFSLPNRESFAVYGSVWLKDNHAGIVTDLMTEDYTCMAKMVGRDEDRLTIQIGGPAPVISPDGSQIDGNHVVYIRDGVLYISRLIKGQTIQIYTVDGRLIHQTIAEEDTYRTAVSPGIYLVKIDDDRYKAM